MTYNESVTRKPDASKEPAGGERPAARGPRKPKYGRREQAQRVNLRSLELRTLNALQDLAREGSRAIQARGETLSVSHTRALEALREPRSARFRTFGEAGSEVLYERAANGGGMIVRRERETGDVYLQELERAGSGMRPVVGIEWKIRRSEVGPLARALMLAAGLSPDLPPYCAADSMGFDCRRGEITDPHAAARHQREVGRSLLEEATCADTLRTAYGAPAATDTSAGGAHG